MSKWISIDDSLPDQDQYVLTYLKDGKPSIRISWYSTFSESWCYLGAGGEKITHWMELPEFPTIDN
jgi:Protein of unknown function (DUF551)